MFAYIWQGIVILVYITFAAYAYSLILLHLCAIFLHAVVDPKKMNMDDYKWYYDHPWKNGININKVYSLIHQLKREPKRWS